jgi:hypothetical protein
MWRGHRASGGWPKQLLARQSHKNAQAPVLFMAFNFATILVRPSAVDFEGVLRKWRDAAVDVILLRGNLLRAKEPFWRRLRIRILLILMYIDRDLIAEPSIKLAC